MSETYFFLYGRIRPHSAYRGGVRFSTYIYSWDYYYYYYDLPLNPMALPLALSLALRPYPSSTALSLALRPYPLSNGSIPSPTNLPLTLWPYS
jgi:hypothetical protein